MARTRLVCWALLLGTLVLYAPVRSHDFINYDDPDYVTSNRFVNHGFTHQGVVWAFARIHGESTYWHPLTWLSHMLDCELFGLNPAGHHVVNVLLHGLNAVLLFLVFFKMTGAPWRSAMLAALFAWHPLQVDTVAWVAERKNLLSALFWIAAMAAYLRYARGPTVLRYSVVLLCYVAGLMCKPILVVLPCVLLLLDYWPLRRWTLPSSRQSDTANRFTPPSLGKLVVEKLPFFAFAAASSFITIVGHQRLGSMRASEVTPLSDRLGNAVVSYVRYLRKTFWPTDLAVFYPHPGDWPAAMVVGSAVLLAVITALVVWHMRRVPYLAVGWLWFLGVLVPYSGILQAGQQAMADRFAYLPLIGLFIMFVWGAADVLTEWKRRSVVLGALAAVVLILCAATTRKQLGYWQNSITLFTRTLAVTTNNAPAHINLGVGLEKEGRMDEALQHYQAALQIEPRQPQIHNNIGNVLDSMGRTEDAILSYQHALQLRPGVALVHNNLGMAFSRQRKFDEALGHYSEAMRLAPHDPEPHFLAARALLAKGEALQAMEQFRAAVRLDEYHAKTLTWYARALASHEDDNIRNGAEAIRLAERAVELTGGEQPMALDVLAMAYAEAGRFDDAAGLLEQTIKELKSAGQTDYAAELEARLQLYRAAKPFRDNPRASSAR